MRARAVSLQVASSGAEGVGPDEGEWKDADDEDLAAELHEAVVAPGAAAQLEGVPRKEESGDEWQELSEDELPVVFEHAIAPAQLRIPKTESLEEGTNDWVVSLRELQGQRATLGNALPTVWLYQIAVH
jgi:hypothetical protein